MRDVESEGKKMVNRYCDFHIDENGDFFALALHFA